ncbi:MAG: hypothetical protein EP330_10340 [Deltaproteobacteria bacterium]|nr:MAG: hypothetical protein EP330_10340 [Deltaproteobacteria bacterium]
MLGTTNFIRAFPFYIEVDRELSVVGVGPSAEKLGLRAHQPLKDQLALVRPRRPMTFESLATLGSHLLVFSTDNGLRLRGQVIQEKPERLLLLLSAWMGSSADLDRANLTLADFALHDSVGDYALLLSGRERDLREQRSLATSLMDERMELQRAYRHLAVQNALGRFLEGAPGPSHGVYARIIGILEQGLEAVGAVHLFDGEVLHAEGVIPDGLERRLSRLPSGVHRLGELPCLVLRIGKRAAAVVLPAGYRPEGLEEVARAIELRIATWRRARDLEQRLRDSEAQFRRLFDKTSDFLFLANASGEITLANESWGPGMEGTQLNEHVVDAPPGEVDRMIAQACAGERVRTTVVVKRGPESMYFELQLGPGNPGVAGSFHDVTSRVSTESALRHAEAAAVAAVQARSALVRSAGHEMRTPLSALMGMTDLARTSSDEERASYLEHIAAGAERLSRLVEGTLDVSRIQAGEMRLRTAPTDLAQVVQACASGFPDVVVKLQHGMPELEIDPTRARQVLEELLSNAVKFGKGRIDLSVAARRLDDQADVTIAVEDRGPGMSREQLARVFEPYVRFHHEDSEGVGLGLTIARAVSRAMSGDLTIESTGEGTRAVAHWRVPVVASKLPAVLVVGTMPEALSRELDRLAEVDTPVVFAADATTALRFGRQRAYSTVLIDQELSGMPAETLAETLRDLLGPDCSIARVSRTDSDFAALQFA